MKGVLMLSQSDQPQQAPTPLPLHVQHMLATTRACPRCGTIDLPALGPGAGQHWRRLCCRHCQCFLQWLSQYSDEERLARQRQRQREVMATKPPTEGQLGFLKGLGDSGPPPANRAEASERI